MPPAVPAVSAADDDGDRHVPIFLRPFHEVAAEYTGRREALERAKAEGGAILMKWAFSQRIVMGAWEFLDGEGWSPVTLGSQEQPRVHPAIKVLTDALETIERADAALLALLKDPTRVSFTEWPEFNSDSGPRFE